MVSYRLLLTTLTIILLILPECQMKLSVVNFQRNLRSSNALLSAVRTCSESVKPPVIYVHSSPLNRLVTKSISSFGPVVIHSKLPSRGPSLIVLPNTDSRELNKYHWNPENCYVLFVLSGSTSPFKLLKTMWEVYKLHYAFVVINGTSEVVFFNPFKQKYIQTLTPSLEKYDNLHRAKIKLVMFARPPVLIPLKDNRYGGVDGEMLLVFQSKMNFTMVALGTSDHKRYGYKGDDGSFVGTLRDVLSGRVDLAINGHFIKDYGTDNLTFTHYVQNDKLCALVPKAGLVPHLFVIMKCFSPDVWASVLISYVLIATIQYLIKYSFKVDSANVIINIVQNIFNVATPRCPRLISDRVVQVSMLFFTFIIVNAFQGQIITFLYTPIYFPEIDTLQGIDDSGLEIFSSKPEVETMLAEDPKLYSLAKKVHTTTDQDVQCAARTRDIVRFSRNNHIDKVSLSVKENLHLVSECLSTFYIGYVVPRSSPLVDRLNVLISRAVESGLVLYWNADTDSIISKDISQSREINVLTISDLQIAFIIIFAGLSLSLCVFFVEIIVYQYKKPNQYNN